MILTLTVALGEKKAKPEPCIVSTPNICGGSARIKDTRIPVWGLALARKQGFTDCEILEMYPHLQMSDLTAAWEYQASHAEEINSEIENNQSA
ncbi:MAG: DUF433 domain-containing protein [Gemmatales bacterium]